jgi:hypothetical protein
MPEQMQETVHRGLFTDGGCSLASSQVNTKLCDGRTFSHRCYSVAELSLSLKMRCSGIIFSRDASFTIHTSETKRPCRFTMWQQAWETPWACLMQLVVMNDLPYRSVGSKIVLMRGSAWKHGAKCLNSAGLSISNETFQLVLCIP